MLLILQRLIAIRTRFTSSLILIKFKEGIRDHTLERHKYSSMFSSKTSGANGIDVPNLNERWAVDVSRGRPRDRRLGTTFIVERKNNSEAVPVIPMMCGIGVS